MVRILRDGDGSWPEELCWRHVKRKPRTQPRYICNSEVRVVLFSVSVRSVKLGGPSCQPAAGTRVDERRRISGISPTKLICRRRTDLTLTPIGHSGVPQLQSGSEGGTEPGAAGSYLNVALVWTEVKLMTHYRVTIGVSHALIGRVYRHLLSQFVYCWLRFFFEPNYLILLMESDIIPPPGLLHQSQDGRAV